MKTPISFVLSNLIIKKISDGGIDPLAAAIASIKAMQQSGKYFGNLPSPHGGECGRRLGIGFGAGTDEESIACIVEVTPDHIRLLTVLSGDSKITLLQEINKWLSECKMPETDIEEIKKWVACWMTLW
jgi:hypothetical protein